MLRFLSILDRLQEIVDAIITGKNIALWRDVEVTMVLKKGQAMGCPDINSLLVYTREVVESRNIANFSFSANAERVRQHLTDTRCPCCELALLWHMAHNGLATMSEKQTYKLIFAHRAQEIIHIHSRANCAQ